MSKEADKRSFDSENEVARLQAQVWSMRSQVDTLTATAASDAASWSAKVQKLEASLASLQARAANPTSAGPS